VFLIKKDSQNKLEHWSKSRETPDTWVLDQAAIDLKTTQIEDKISQGLECMEKAQTTDQLLGVSNLILKMKDTHAQNKIEDFFMYNKVGGACYNIIAVYVSSRISDASIQKYEEILKEAEQVLKPIVDCDKDSSFYNPGFEVRGIALLFLAHLYKLQHQEKLAEEHMMWYVKKCVSTLRKSRRNAKLEGQSVTCFACGKRIRKVVVL
jgi:hypothetical protein